MVCLLAQVDVVRFYANRPAAFGPFMAQPLTEMPDLGSTSVRCNQAGYPDAWIWFHVK